MAAHGHLDETIIPGTVHLVDLEGTMHAKHASGAAKDVVLIPAPSADPDDPLNWSPRRKLLATLSMCMYTLMLGISTAVHYSVLVPITEETGISLGDLNAGTGYMFLLLGWGCLFWQAVALQYGKRPVYLFSLLSTLGIMLWVPHATTQGAWLGSKILQGFVGAPIESLVEISITDIYFTHERGAYMGLYALMLAGSNFFAPIIAGFINDSQGWEWVMYWSAIFLGIGFVFCFFFMEETNYDRKPLEFVQSSTGTPGTSTPKEGVMSTSTDPEKTGQITNTDTVSSNSPEGIVEYQPKTFMQKLKLLDKPRPNNLFTMMYRPFLFFSLPSVVYAGFCYGSNLVWFTVLNATASLILSGAPYNFRPSMVGVAYVSPLIGVIVGAWYSGMFGDKIVLRLARRNKGVLEAEHRLWLFSASLVLIPGSLILWGVGASQQIHWFGLIFAMGVIACSNTIGVTLSVNYCVDAYKNLSGEAMVTVILIRNTMSFAVSYGVTPWVTNMGYQNAFILAAFAGLAQVLTFLLVVKWGKGWREASMVRYYKYVKQSQALGIGH